MGVRGIFNGVCLEFEMSREYESYEDYTPIEGWAAQVLAGYPHDRRVHRRPLLRLMPRLVAGRPIVTPRRTREGNVLIFPTAHLTPSIEVQTPRGLRSYAMSPAMTLIVKALQQIDYYASPADRARIEDRLIEARRLLASIETKIQEDRE